jgi:nitroreductase
MGGEALPAGMALLRAPRAAPDPAGRPPTGEELRAVLEAATAVPDHGRLRPWRFVVATGDARGALGDALAAALVEARPDAAPAAVASVRAKPLSAPAVVVLVASPVAGSNVPRWEQHASAASCGYAMVLAGTALGLGAVWKSAGVLDGAGLRRVLALGPDEAVFGWILLGTRPGTAATVERPVAPLEEVVAVLGAAGDLTPWGTVAGGPARAGPGQE